MYVRDKELPHQSYCSFFNIGKMYSSCSHQTHHRHNAAIIIVIITCVISRSVEYSIVKTTVGVFIADGVLPPSIAYAFSTKATVIFDRHPPCVCLTDLKFLQQTSTELRRRKNHCTLRFDETITTTKVSLV